MSFCEPYPISFLFLTDIPTKKWIDAILNLTNIVFFSLMKLESEK